ncbi:hypothetical protein SSCG_01849 [Streptomyces clavuligerus]|nr:hypothetical protein SSCG_01849 [Streptomyces clavuligerus]
MLGATCHIYIMVVGAAQTPCPQGLTCGNARLLAAGRGGGDGGAGGGGLCGLVKGVFGVVCGARHGCSCTVGRALPALHLLQVRIGAFV